MEPTEVRIGNLVLILTGNSPNPSGHLGFIKAITRTGEFDFTLPEHDAPVIISAENCSGIEIKPDWLKLNGFEYNEEENLYRRGLLKLQYFEDIQAYRFYLSDDMIFRPIVKYIHEFQNVHKVLTTREFDIKVNPYTP